MTEQELVNKIADDLQTQGFFQREDYCEVSHREQAEWIMRSAKQAGYVRLADDQSLPGLPEFYSDWGGESGKFAYVKSRDDMLKAGFRKVDL